MNQLLGELYPVDVSKPILGSSGLVRVLSHLLGILEAEIPGGLLRLQDLLNGSL